ncbi:MAG: T9SS type B sorting domain-containing protein [Bacteroidia bacterium]|nr:T9SS type B sorting domain-containing protein [Bacteroidia bacterium]MBT8279397.1 T9SS type B sorting domain-containing protein [Bacteroidia bacterium]NND25059.1 T9SS type B sorting domain-containing protein [Flavobacteriaceae bacterium]NNK59387.1 T9SS type B sorting domain-containing protein [Flavobacteriaceae bacterium]RZW45221.1 MAG: T9SS type B sorting domain-containing protein [Flavobacteriaceae bacterium]
MKTALKIAIAFILVTSPIYGQREASNWYFGSKAGLDFNSGTPVPLLNGQLDTVEGCETFSDSDGNLLFYTDGKMVWNRNHQLMPNGDNLLGSFSSSQSALIIPKIDDETIFYIITADVVQAYENGVADGNGLNYSVVDITLEGGLGDVTEKNINLLTQGSEKITAVSAFDGTGYWLVTHRNSNFYAFKIGANGVNTTPVITTLGPNISHFDNIRGSIKSSPNGSQIAIAHTIFEPLYNGYVYLYDFDTSTGILSNELLIAEGYVFYGVEFSSNSTKLYASGKAVDELTNSTTDIKIFQYDLTVPNIPDSEFLIFDFPNLFLSDLAGSLQIGIDKKIYHSIPNTMLSVIRTPNLAGLDSDFRSFDVDLGGRSTKFGLPPFIQSFFESVVRIENFCIDSDTEFFLETDAVIDAVAWNFGDPNSGANNTSSLLNPTHTFSTTGVFTVTLEVEFANRPPKTFVEFIEISETPDAAANVTLIQCDVDGLDDGISLFNLMEAQQLFDFGNSDLTANYFLNVTDAQNNENALPEIGYQNIVNDQIIYARVFENAECYVITEVTLHVEPISDLGTYDTLDICSPVISLATLIEYQQIYDQLLSAFPDTTITLFRTEENALLELEPVIEDIYIGITSPLEMYFRIESENACNFIGKVDLNVMATPEVENQTQLFCPGGSNILDAGAGFNSYLWSTGEITQTIIVEDPGSYWVEVSNAANCISTISVNVINSEDIEITNVIVNDFQTINTVEVLISDSDGFIEYSLDGENYFTSNRFRSVQPGLYDVYVRKDNCSVVTETILVGGFPNFFTPNGDGINDTWQMKRPEFFENAVIEIYDRYGKLVKTMTTTSEGWNGLFNGQMMTPDDYWFVIKFSDRFVHGHFTLKL